MHKAYPTSINVPLFSIDCLPVTQVKVPSHLSKTLCMLGLDSQFHNFHTFRRSRSTLAFNQNIDLQKIKDHGTFSLHLHSMAESTSCQWCSRNIQKGFFPHNVMFSTSFLILYCTLVCLTTLTLFGCVAGFLDRVRIFTCKQLKLCI